MDEKTKQLVDDATVRSNYATVGPWHVADGALVCEERDTALGRKRTLGNMYKERDAKFIAHARTDVPDLCSTVREQSERAERAEQALANVLAKLTELVKDWDDVARDTILFSGGYREAVTICSTSIKELIDQPSPTRTR